MKNTTLAVLVAALSITSLWDHAVAQNDRFPAAPAQKPINAQATAGAWAAFLAGENEKAITNANRCIERFRDAADRIQSHLETEKAALPKGVVSTAEKQHLAKYQILHDVATCYLIKGWAEEKLGHKEEARKAYTKTKKYTHARSSRPTEESFWSPAEKASDLLLK
jgi:tetratricopeptide (TPR) repeat protein